jgi:hypothetical protein
VSSGQVPLSVSGQVVLDGSGNGQVQLGPAITGTSWTPSNVGVLVAPTSTTVVSQFKIYNGAPIAANFIGGTYTGDNNSSAISVGNMYPGSVITGVWTGGNPGATATMTLTGTQNVPGAPA